MLKRRDGLALLACVWPLTGRPQSPLPSPRQSPAHLRPNLPPQLRAALARAHALREQALREGDQAYGAVVIDASGHIIGEAPSRVVTLGLPGAHAEREALRDAAKRRPRGDLGGLVLVSSSRPCALCETAAAREGIATLVHGDGVDSGRPRAPSTPPLVGAAERGDLAAVRQLLQQGEPLHWRDDHGRNAVLAATRGGHTAVALLLIEHGADVNAQDPIQDSAFLLAGARGHTEIIRHALPTADLLRLNRYGGTALIPACHYGHVETVRLLLGSAIAIDHVNRLGWTALLEAVILGDGGPRHTEIVRLLLAHGAQVNLADDQGATPLDHALRLGHTDQVALLRRAGGR